MADKLFANRLIGFDPVAERQRARETELRLMSQFAGNPYASIGYSLGSLIGSGAKKLFNIEDEGTKRASDVQAALSQASSMFTPGSPEYFKDLAQRLEKYPDARAIALEEASKAEGAVEKTFRETQKFVGDFPEALAGEAQKVEASVLNRLRRAGVNVETDPNTGELLTPIPPEVLAQVEQLPEVQRLNQLTQIATRSSMKQQGGITPSDTFAQVGLSLGIQPKSDLSQYSPEESKKIIDTIQKQKEGVAGAGVPGAGELKVTDVAGARKLTEDIVGGDKARLTTIGLLKTNIATIRQKNPTAVPQLERGLVKLVGDSQIGQNEVRQALGASGFPQSVIEGVNRFFSGLPTDLKIDQVEASIEAIEDYYANRLNKGLGTASSILQDTKIPKSTIDKIVGQPYTSAVEKKNKAKISSLKGQDKEAYNWAKSKPDDPRSAAILNKLGVR